MKRLSNLLMLAGGLLCLLSTSRALAQSDAVLGIGYNAQGQLGNNTTTNSSLLSPAFHISGIKAIASGYDHTLALDSNGTVWAWGCNSNGQLGTGNTTNSSTPVAIMSGIKAIAAGGFHSMALDAGGNVYTWGYNANGQLGQGDNADRWTPTWVSSIGRIKSIACGGWHSLFLSEDGNFYVCGWNAYGQLGDGGATDINTPWNNFFVWGPSIKSMAGGFAHTLIQYDDYHVEAAGYNGDGELGNGTNTDSSYFYNTGLYARSIAAGEFHSLAVGLDGSALAWGYNGYGELGTGDTADRYVPTQMLGATNVKAISGGGSHTLVLEADGKAFATGENDTGQLGDGTTINRLKIVPVKNATLIGAIAAGENHSVLLKPFTQSLATGDNSFGELGIGSFVSQKNTPVPMKTGNSIIAVSAGPSGWHTLMLRADGTVWACGRNDFGELGNGTTTSSYTPVEVKGPSGVGYLENIIAIAAGNFHSMALSADGTVYTWGRNSHGQLGLGDAVDRYYPDHVPGVYDITAIAAGGYHSLVLGYNGMMAGCGYNGYGQLDLGDNNDRSSFTAVPFWYPFKSLAGGGYHTLVRNTGYDGEFFQGQIMSCGLNYYGELGTGDTNSYDTLTFDQGTLAVMLAAGNLHSLHLNAYGAVYGTGYNGDGELGLGDAANRTSWNYIPVQAVSIACGFSHSLFADVYGNLFACGNGANGQLGNGSTSNQYSLAYVPGAPYTTGMAGGWGHTLILTAPPVLAASLKLSLRSVVGGASVTGTVSLTGLAGAGGQTVYLGADSGYVSLPATVTVAPGSKTATFTIHTTRVSARAVVPIFANLNGSSVSASLTINP